MNCAVGLERRGSRFESSFKKRSVTQSRSHVLQEEGKASYVQLKTFEN